jgi:hypothetical protein
MRSDQQEHPPDEIDDIRSRAATTIKEDRTRKRQRLAENWAPKPGEGNQDRIRKPAVQTTTAAEKMKSGSEIWRERWVCFRSGHGLLCRTWKSKLRIGQRADPAHEKNSLGAEKSNEESIKMNCGKERFFYSKNRPSAERQV